MKKVKLIGGSRDGDTVEAHCWQKGFNLPARISTEEIEGLVIDQNTQWKHPDDFYVRVGSGDFMFSHRVNYKPDAEPAMKNNKTPPEAVDQWRAEFELHHLSTDLDRKGFSYQNVAMDFLWQGFLLGRQTACIELPKTMGAESCLLSYPEVRTAIIAQGYQVRDNGE